MANPTYRDVKGRIRWRRNDEVAAIVKQLGEYLIIGGYPEDHAKRYAQLAHSISRWPDSIDVLTEQGQCGNRKICSSPIGSTMTELLPSERPYP